MNNDNRNHSRKPNPIHHEHQKDREHIHTDVKQLMSPVQDPVTAPEGFNYESAQIRQWLEKQKVPVEITWVIFCV